MSAYIYGFSCSFPPSSSLFAMVSQSRCERVGLHDVALPSPYILCPRKRRSGVFGNRTFWKRPYQFSEDLSFSRRSPTSAIWHFYTAPIVNSVIKETFTHIVDSLFISFPFLFLSYILYLYMTSNTTVSLWRAYSFTYPSPQNIQRHGSRSTVWFGVPEKSFYAG